MQRRSSVETSSRSGKPSAPWGVNEKAPLLKGSLSVLMDATNRCNLRCRMCYFSFDRISGRTPIEMPVQTFESIAGRLFPYADTLYLSAACEPLLHPRFTALLAIAGRYRPWVLCFLTNGQRLTEEVSKACITHGVTEIHASIDGATEESYNWARRGGSFQRLVENLERLACLKKRMDSSLPVVQFNITLMKRNVSELGQFARLARRVGVEKLACRHMILYAGLGMEQESLFDAQQWANERMEQGLREIATEGIHLTTFPDFYSNCESPAPPWQAPRMPPHPDLRLSNHRWWYLLLARQRWAFQLARHAKRQSEPDGIPFGCVDEPASEEIVFFNSLHLAGWGLHRSRIDRITICREVFRGETGKGTNPLGLRTLGEARRHTGSRPDVVDRFPGYPEVYRAGWSYGLNRHDLPADRPRIPIHVVAWGRDGSYAIP